MRRGLLAMTAVLALGAVCAQAQLQGMYRIAGTVVSDGDGHPLQRATVEILTAEGRKAVQTVSSDEYGHFEFTGVAAGNFVLQGHTAGYLNTTYQEHEAGFNTGIITGAGVDTEHLELRLRPQAELTGTVVNEADEPVEHASVRLFHETRDTGETRILPSNTANTNDLGQFEFPRLAPGTYYIAVSATPWYAVHPQPVLQVQGNGGVIGRLQAQRMQTGFVDSIDPSLDMAYPMTFYPGVTDSARASAIALRGGDMREVTMQLQPVPALTLTLDGVQVGNNRPFPQLRMMVFGQPEPVQVGSMSNGQGGVVIGGLTPGDYLVTQPGPNGNQGSEPIHLADHSTSATAPDESATGQIHVTLRSEGDEKVPGRVQVILAAVHGNERVSHAADDKNEATLNAAPGDYWIEAGAGRRQMVRRVTAGGEVVPDNRVHLTAGAKLDLTVTLASGTHTLKAVAMQDGKPCAGALVLLFPTAERADIHDSWLEQSDLDGSFNLTALPAGKYTLLAIEDGWKVEWRKADVLARYLPGAVTVEIPDGSEKVQTLKEPVPAQAK